MAWQRVRINVPEDLSASEREALGQDIVEFIRRRTESGVGVRRRGLGYENYRFPGYSKAYIESLDFKIAGKSPSQVDLTLSGDMLAALDVISHRPGSIMVGYQNGTEENSKAEGNQLGAYGGRPNNRKARSFLGLTSSELDTLVSKYKAPDRLEDKTKKAGLSEKLLKALLLDKKEDGDGGGQ